MKTPMFFISLNMLFSCCYAANSMLTQGQSLQDGQTLISQSEDFVLGFFSPGNTSNRYVGIWYNKISVKTIVWVANRETPVSDLSGVLTFGSDGNLLVQDGTGKSVWSTNISVVVKNATAYLLDSGNFILSIDELRNPEKGLWMSFRDPTDTYLPGIRIGYSPRSKKDFFTSWKSVDDPARGNFSLGIDPKGLLEIDVWRGSEKLWRSGLWDGQIFIGVPSMSSNYLYGSRVSEVGGNSFFSYTARNTSVLLRFHISWEGKYRLLMWDEGKQEWSTYWGEPANECEPYNTCGVFGRCSVSSTPICSCLKGFVPKSKTEWDKGNWSGGCVRKTPLQCDKNLSSARGGKRDAFLELERMKLPDFYFSIPNINKTQCANICVSNCSCKAYAYVDGIQCLTWDQDFVDIQMFDDGGQKLSIRLAASEIGTSKSKNIIVIVIVVVLGVIILCVSAYIFWRRRTKSGHLCKGGNDEAARTHESTSREIWKDCSKQDDMEGNSGGGNELTMHSFREILNATTNFSSSNKLGEGGFGPVYKGTLPRGIEIAVKRLSRKSGQGLEEFKNEIVLIAKLQHRNLVRLTGYCLEAEEMILVYEYLPKKSLDAYIFSNPEEPLTWVQRFNIIEGIARGLLYLHRDSRLRIIHRDLKAGNILLDEDMTPKISDFGMAKIFGGNENEKNTRRVVGTIGYMAPEYAMEGLFSVKSDVYSFGVLILEIISGKKNQYRHPEYSTNLLGYAWKLWGEERWIDFIDPSIRDSCSECDALRCINVGLLCVQDSALDRPIMSSVVLMLESDTAVLPNPRQPTFTVGRSAMEMELSVDSSQGLTKNSMTDTMLIGR